MRDIVAGAGLDSWCKTGSRWQSDLVVTGVGLVAAVVGLVVAVAGRWLLVKDW